jgi:putative membrane protein
VTWWCAATREPWTWVPRAYPGVWLFVAVLSITAVVVVRRSGIRPTGKQAGAFWGGVLAMWVATDWPIGALGAGYLASAHMLQYLIYTLIAAPLLLVGIPEPLARRALARVRAYRAYRTLAHPVASALAANVILVATHAPFTVDTLRASQLGSFGMDVIWIASGLILWLPVCGPISEARLSYPIRCVYLFVAAGIIPMLPGGFMTFSDFPLYSTFELAPRVGSIEPLGDQRTAGALMKVGNVPLIWPVIAVMFWRWAQEERVVGLDPPRRSPAPTPPEAVAD